MRRLLLWMEQSKYSRDKRAFLHERDYCNISLIMLTYYENQIVTRNVRSKGFN